MINITLPFESIEKAVEALVVFQSFITKESHGKSSDFNSVVLPIGAVTPPTEAAPEAPATPQKASSEKIDNRHTLEDAKEALKAFLVVKTQPEAREFLQKEWNIVRLLDLDPNKYTAFVERVQTIIAQSKGA